LSVYDDLGSRVQRALTATLTRLGYASPLVIYKHQNAPEPNKSFVAIHILLNRKEGRSTKAIFLQDVVDNEDVGRHYAQQHYKALLQLSFVGAESGDMAFDLDAALSGSVSTQEDFLKEDISLISHSDARSNPQLRETRWVDGFTMDLNLGFSVQHTEDLNWVEFITIDGVQIPIAEP
jgi:hypothetical protein